MRALVFVLFAAVAAAQPAGDARGLLADVAAAMYELKSWRATGTMTVELDLGGRVSRTESAFTMAKASPKLMRLDVTGSAPTTSIVCDGATSWVSLPDLGRYNHLPYTSNPRCSPAAPWPDLLQDAEAVSSRGSGAVEIGGSKLSCELVEVALSRLPLLANVNDRTRSPRVTQGTRTLCIDRARRSVLRDEVRAVLAAGELGLVAAQLVAVSTYTSFERDPDLPGDLFRVEPSAGSVEDDHLVVPQPGALAAGPLFVVRDDSTGASAPRLAHRTEPRYTREARRKHIEGTVALRLVVGADGVPQGIQILHSLDPGLNQAAIKAVSTWRFEPGRKNGKPVAVLATVEVNFRLLDRPPH